VTAGRLKLGGQIAAIGLVAGLLVLLIWKVAGGSESEVDGLRSGKTPPAPGFDLPRLSGDGKVSLDSYRGKAVVVNFWASWCQPCKAEAPLLEQAWRKYRGRGLVVVGVNSQDLSSDARRFAKQVGWTYPLVRDGAGDILGPYAVAAFPETFFVDRTGKLIARIDGEVSEDELHSNIERALA
jgi:cytochrome c biogenesis protein CcmG, thiol:disulfide interchange protein DsbE